MIGAEPYERSASRATHRNGHRPKLPNTGVGRLELQIPKLRVGSFFPTLLEPRRRGKHPRRATMLPAPGIWYAPSASP